MTAWKSPGIWKENMSRPDNSPPIDPTRHGFVLLPRHQPPGGVRYYEYRNHARADGVQDYHRLNLYLTQRISGKGQAFLFADLGKGSGFSVCG